MWLCVRGYVAKARLSNRVLAPTVSWLQETLFSCMRCIFPPLRVTSPSRGVLQVVCPVMVCALSAFHIYVMRPAVKATTDGEWFLFSLMSWLWCVFSTIALLSWTATRCLDPGRLTYRPSDDRSTWMSCTRKDAYATGRYDEADAESGMKETSVVTSPQAAPTDSPAADCIRAVHCYGEV